MGDEHLRESLPGAGPSVTSAPASFLALGDSYTHGEGIDPAGSWPARLVQLAREHGTAIAEPRIIARTGWTTDELSAAIDREDPRGPFDLVSLMVGVNDQYRGRTEESYRRRFEPLVRRAVTFAGDRPGRVIVFSVPDWGVTPFAADRDAARVAESIDAFNAINRETSARCGTHYIDVTPVSRRAADVPGMLASDGLHPSARMYEAWAHLVLPVALQALR
jgi:lysophospholipase L1-like esterase